ncbi:histone RNA hairpin-binding protein RNA-binding domain-containing protein [Gorgonomyces haynaldii]|nr:histone RNA hairpin-binding protein RNA-binding domain-containing protein [Gorgonomyces haynaldii]
MTLNTTPSSTIHNGTGKRGITTDPTVSRLTQAKKTDESDTYSVADSVDTGVSMEVNSIVESLFTQSSHGSGVMDQSEERRLQQRQKQIDYGKNTKGYENYIRTIPKASRGPEDPETPDKHSNCSKRAWDGLVRSWRRKLHRYDPQE